MHKILIKIIMIAVFCGATEVYLSASQNQSDLSGEFRLTTEEQRKRHAEQDDDASSMSRLNLPPPALRPGIHELMSQDTQVATRGAALSEFSAMGNIALSAMSDDDNDATVHGSTDNHHDQPYGPAPATVSALVHQRVHLEDAVRNIAIDRFAQQSGSVDIGFGVGIDWNQIKSDCLDKSQGEIDLYLREHAYDLSILICSPATNRRSVEVQQSMQQEIERLRVEVETLKKERDAVIKEKDVAIGLTVAAIQSEQGTKIIAMIVNNENQVARATIAGLLKEKAAMAVVQKDNDDAVKKRIQELLLKISVTEGELGEARRSKRYAESHVESLQRDKRDVTLKAQELEKKINKLRLEAKQLRENNDDKMQQVRSLGAVVLEMQGVNGKLSEELSRARAELEHMRTTNNAWKQAQGQSVTQEQNQG